MTRRVIDYKGIDMTDEEFEQYQRIVKECTYGNYSGKDQFKNIFEVDGDGCITIIKPPSGKQTFWAVLFFLQNLMINQRLRRMERWIREKLDEESTNG